MKQKNYSNNYMEEQKTPKTDNGIKQNGREKELEELRELKKELEIAKDVLEIRVRARTRELDELTQGLEKQVQARTAEIEKKSQELEKIIKVMVGRELKMIELKKENQALKEKLAKHKLLL